MDMLKLHDSFLDLVEELRLARITVAENESRIKELVEKCHDNERKLEETNAKNQSLLDERATSLDNVNKALEDKIKHLQAEKNKLRINSDGWEKEMRALKEEVRTLQVAKYSLERTVREQCHKLETQSQAKTAHSQLVTETDMKYRDIAKQMGTYSSMLDSLKEQVSEAVRMNDMLEYTNKHQNCWIASLNSNVEEKRREIVKVRAELAKKPEEARDQQRSLQMKMEKAERDLLQSSIKVDDISLQLRESKRSQEVMAGQLQRAHELAERCLTSKKKLEESLSVKNDRLSALSSQCKQLEAEQRKAHAELGELSEKINDVTTKKNEEIQLLQSKWQKLNEDYGTLQKAKASLEDLNHGWASKNRDLESLLKYKAEMEKADEGTVISKEQASISVASEETQTPTVRLHHAGVMTEGGLVGDILQGQQLRDALVQTDDESQCTGPRDNENFAIGAERPVRSDSPLCESKSEVTLDGENAEKENMSTVVVESVPEGSATDKMHLGADQRQCETHCSEEGTCETRTCLSVNIDYVHAEIPAKVPRLSEELKTCMPDYQFVPPNNNVCQEDITDKEMWRDQFPQSILKSTGIQPESEGANYSRTEVSTVQTDVNTEHDSDVIVVTADDISKQGAEEEKCMASPSTSLTIPDDSNARQEESNSTPSAVNTTMPADAKEEVVIPSSYAQENTSPLEQGCHITYKKGNGSILTEARETEETDHADSKVIVQGGGVQSSKDKFRVSQGESRCARKEHGVREPVLKASDAQRHNAISKMDQGPLLNPLAGHQMTKVYSNSFHAAAISSQSSLVSPKLITSVRQETKTTSTVKSSWCTEYSRVARQEAQGMPASWCDEHHKSLSTAAAGAPVVFSPLLTAQQLKASLREPATSLLCRPVPISVDNSPKSTRDISSSMAGATMPLYTGCLKGEGVTNKVQRDKSPHQEAHLNSPRDPRHSTTQLSSEPMPSLGLIKKDTTCIPGHVQFADTLDQHLSSDSRPCTSDHQPGESGDAGDDTSLFSDDDDDNDIKVGVASQIERVQLFLSKDRLKRPKSKVN